MMGAFAPIASAAPSGPQNQSNQNQSNQNPGNHQQTPTQKRITTFGSCAALNRTYPHGVARAGAHVGAVELADPVVGEAGPAADGAGAGLVADQAHGEVDAQAIAVVTVVGNSHCGSPLGVAGRRPVAGIVGKISQNGASNASAAGAGYLPGSGRNS